MLGNCQLQLFKILMMMILYIITTLNGERRNNKVKLNHPIVILRWYGTGGTVSSNYNGGCLCRVGSASCLSFGLTVDVDKSASLLHKPVHSILSVKIFPIGG